MPFDTLQCIGLTTGGVIRPSSLRIRRGVRSVVAPSVRIVGINQSLRDCTFGRLDCSDTLPNLGFDAQVRGPFLILCSFARYDRSSNVVSQRNSILSKTFRAAVSDHR